MLKLNRNRSNATDGLMRHSKIKLYNSKGFSLEKRVIPFLVPKFGFFWKGRLITVTSVPLDRPLLIIFGGITIFIVDASSFSSKFKLLQHDVIALSLTFVLIFTFRLLSTLPFKMVKLSSSWNCSSKLESCFFNWTALPSSQF